MREENCRIAASDAVCPSLARLPCASFFALCFFAVLKNAGMSFFLLLMENKNKQLV